MKEPSAGADKTQPAEQSDRSQRKRTKEWLPAVGDSVVARYKAHAKFLPGTILAVHHEPPAPADDAQPAEPLLPLFTVQYETGEVEARVRLALIEPPRGPHYFIKRYEAVQLSAQDILDQVILTQVTRMPH